MSKNADNLGEVVEIDQSSKVISVGGLEAFEEKTEEETPNSQSGVPYAVSGYDDDGVY